MECAWGAHGRRTSALLKTHICHLGQRLGLAAGQPGGPAALPESVPSAVGEPLGASFADDANLERDAGATAKSGHHQRLEPKPLPGVG